MTKVLTPNIVVLPTWYTLRHTWKERISAEELSLWYVCRPFLACWLMYGSHPTVDGVIFGQVGLSCRTEQAKQASKQHFSMVSALIPGSRLLPWSPAWLAFMMETVTCRLKWTLFSPSWFWSVFDHRNRKQTETSARPQTWFLMFTIVPR